MGEGIHHLPWDIGIAGEAEEREVGLHIHPIHIAGDPVYCGPLSCTVFR